MFKAFFKITSKVYESELGWVIELQMCSNVASSEQKKKNLREKILEYKKTIFFRRKKEPTIFSETIRSLWSPL